MVCSVSASQPWVLLWVTRAQLVLQTAQMKMRSSIRSCGSNKFKGSGGRIINLKAIGQFPRSILVHIGLGGEASRVCRLFVVSFVDTSHTSLTHFQGFPYAKKTSNIKCIQKICESVSINDGLSHYFWKSKSKEKFLPGQSALHSLR